MTIIDRSHESANKSIGLRELKTCLSRYADAGLKSFPGDLSTFFCNDYDSRLQDR